ncbi:MAG: glutamyl-tRNA reductase [Clostridia bacterium]|nr:glutamyl-tRNA reductase [Clostridia bacterium]
MNILVIGVNYKQTPLEIREKLCFNTDEQRNALAEMVGLEDVDECVILSTCNRTEVYIYSDNPYFDSSIIEKKVCRIKGLEIYDLKKYFYIYSSARAVKHLFKVASGLDSMIMGEDQILRQVKDAYDLALEVRSSGNILNTLFREGITAAKKVKTFTELSKNSVSVGTHAVKLLEKVFNDGLKHKTALVIGAGKIGAIALKNLLSAGIGRVYVTNRTLMKAQDISKGYNNVDAVDYNMRYSVMNDCDIVISSTNSPHYTVTKDLLEKSVKDKTERVFMDLAVPRDIDVDIKTIPWVRYFNIDDLQLEVDKNLDKRLLEVSKAEEIIQEQVTDFEKWYEFRSVLPIVKDIQKFTEDLMNEKMDSTLARLKSASEADKEMVRISVENIVNEILDKFIYNIRNCGSKEDMQVYFRCLSDVIKEN